VYLAAKFPGKLSENDLKKATNAAQARAFWSLRDLGKDTCVRNKIRPGLSEGEVVNAGD